MKLLTTIAAVLISISAYSQESITRGQDTIAYTSPQGEIYNISIYNDLTAEELHYITSEYRNNNFTFRDNEDLRLTMSRYMEDGSVTANWELTQNEQRLLNKYNVLAKQSNKSSSPTSKNNVTVQSNKSSSPTSKNNVTVRGYLKVEYNEGTFTQNGEEISIDRVGELMKQYRVPFYRSRLGGVITQRKNCENEFRRIGIITGTVIATPFSAAGTALFGFITLLALEDGVMGGAVAAGYITAVSGFLTVYSPYLAYVHSTKGRCQNKVDKLCEKLVDKINKAIVRAGPTVQSSNQ